MTPEILLVRHEDGYRVLHGYLRLVSIMSTENETIVDVSGEGKVKVSKTPFGMVVDNDYYRLPLIINEWYATTPAPAPTPY